MQQPKPTWNPPHPTAALEALSKSGYRLSQDPASDVNGQPDSDTPWLTTVECRRGGPNAHIYVQGVDRLAFTGIGMGLRRDLLAISGVTKHQTGDEEFSVHFPSSLLKAVGSVVKARTRRTLSPEHKAKLASVGTRFTPERARLASEKRAKQPRSTLRSHNGAD